MISRNSSPDGRVYAILDFYGGGKESASDNNSDKQRRAGMRTPHRENSNFENRQTSDSTIIAE
jgi:hypothetical protein